MRTARDDQQVTALPRPNNGVASQVITTLPAQPPRAVVVLSRASTALISKLAYELRARMCVCGGWGGGEGGAASWEGGAVDGP